MKVREAMTAQVATATPQELFTFDDSTAVISR